METRMAGSFEPDWDLEVSRGDFRTARIVESACRGGLADGEIEITVEHLALTTNNMTYAALGDEFGYWDAFPGSPGWGRIPAWGHGVVAHSAHPEIDADERYFGFFPVSSRVRMSPRRTRLGIKDEAPHRQRLDRVYNRYARAGEGSAVDEENNALFRPLIITSLALAAHLRHSRFFGADTVIIVSASSKVALGLAVLIQSEIATVGLTSKENLGFVSSAGVLSDVVSYDEIGRLSRLGPSIVVDFSGSAALLARIVGAAGDSILRVRRAGRTHWGTAPIAKRLDRSDPDEVFFAPPHIQGLAAMWGPDEFERRLTEALNHFATVSAAWYARTYADGPADILQSYRHLACGRIDPARLVIARPFPRAAANATPPTAANATQR
jgi:hypothetical protein